MSLFFTLFLLNSASYGKNRSFREKIVENNKLLSKQFDSLAEEIDTLLSNRRGKPYNRSTVSLIGFLEHEEQGEFIQNGHILVDLRLPKLEKKWQLRLSSFDREDEFEGLGRNRDGAAPRKQKVGTSLGFVKSFGNIKTLFRPRLEFKDPLVSSFLLKFNSTLKLQYLNIHWQKKFFTHSIDGVGQALTIDFERPILKMIVFRFFNEAQYLDKDNVFSVSQGPSFRYKFSETIGFSKTLSFNSINRSSTASNPSLSHSYDSYHLGSYRLTLSFSHKILKRVFHYQVSPYLDFAKINNFKGVAGITLRTEVIF